MGLETLSRKDLELIAAGFRNHVSLYGLDCAVFVGAGVVFSRADVMEIPEVRLTTLRNVAQHLDSLGIRYTLPANEIIQESLHHNGHSANLSTYFG